MNPEISDPILSVGTRFFSRTPMDPENARHSLWRKGELFELCGPVSIIGDGCRNCYWFEFSAEFLDEDGNITPKSLEFCRIVKDFFHLTEKALNTQKRAAAPAGTAALLVSC